MKNKKGISAIVATVLIILITVAAVTIIWAAIIPMIDTQLDEATICLAAEKGLSLEDKGYTCINADDTLSVQVALGSENISLESIQLLVSTGGTTTTELVSIDLPGVNEEKVFTTANPYVGADSVSAAAVIQVGNTEKTCAATSPVALVACS